MRNSYVCLVWIFIFDTDQAQNTVTFTSNNHILIYEEQLCTLCLVWIFIFDTDQAQNNVTV